jgi:hypothetical protein
MPRHLIAIAPLLVTILAACGEGYRLEPARVTIDGVIPKAFPAALKTVHDVLVSEGFEDLGKYEEMIAMTQQDNSMPPSVKREQLVRLEREYTYLNSRHHLRVVLTNYTDGVPTEISLSYAPTSGHFVEAAIYDERPGRFGPYGLAFHRRLVAALKQRCGASVRTVETPPPTDQREYRRITAKNTRAAMLAWSLALALPLLVTGAVSRHLLRTLKISANLKRLIFSVVNAWLVAPLPFPAAFILVIPLPNLFAFPWTSTDYYAHVAPFAAVSFPVTFLLCAFSRSSCSDRTVDPSAAAKCQARRARK